MSKKIWLILAGSLILTGCIIFAGVMTVLKWDFRKLSTAEYITNTYEFDSNYHEIFLQTDTADIRFVPSETDKTSVICYEAEKQKHSVSVEEGRLAIELEDTKKWYEHIRFSADIPSITVCLPKGDYAELFVKATTGDLSLSEQFHFGKVDIEKSTGDVNCKAFTSGEVKIKTTTGDISVADIAAEKLELTVSTGKVTVSDVTCAGDVAIHLTTGKVKVTDLNCQNLASTGTTGDLSLKRVIAQGQLCAERSTGDVKLEECDAAELSIVTTTGDVRGSLLTDKVFLVQTSTGDTDVPKSTTGGKCEITTKTGDIRLTISG